MSDLHGVNRYRRLDVRRIIAQGGEPLVHIREALGQLASDEALAVQAPFLPSPLIELLTGEGYRSRFESAGAGNWVVYFWRAAE